MYSSSLKGILMGLFLFNSLAALAKVNANQPEKHLLINHNWHELTQDEYIDNRVACEYKRQAHQWSKNVWPKENTMDKPDFSEVVDWGAINKKVYTSLKMQSVLADRFNIKITPAMLQHDLDRMAQNTRDAKGLKALYLLFNNDPTTISECVSRPYLVKSKLENSFYSNSEIHAESKAKAQSELDVYLNTHNTNKLSIQPEKAIFLIKNENLLETKEPSELNEIIELNENEFELKLSQFDKTELHETKDRYTYQELISQTVKSIKVNTLVWPKLKLMDWLNQQTNTFLVKAPLKTEMKLAGINSGNSNFNHKSVTEDQWLSQQYFPTQRYNHSGIWTGNEMIIWGGNINSNLYLNSGGRYNPTTDSWEKISNSNSPLGTTYHTAVWTGTEMIVWGGVYRDDGVTHYSNRGGRYNPVMDNWLSTTTITAPSKRADHTAIWTGTEMIIWGGRENTYLYLNSGARYNPSTNSWDTISSINAPIARSYHTAIWSDSQLIVWGGAGEDSDLNNGGRFDPISNSWEEITLSNAPSARRNHTAVWSGNEMIVWGGDGEGDLNNGGRYDPVSNSWEEITLSNAPSARRNHTAVWSGNEMIVWGGLNDDDNLNTGGRYNPITNSWQSISTNNAPSYRNSHTAIWTGLEMIVWGGKYHENGSAAAYVPFANGARYNPIDDNWQATASSSAPAGRKYHTSIWSGSEMIVWGGLSFSNYIFNNGGLYNPVTDSWRIISLTNVPRPRYNHTAIWTGQEMLVWGGSSYMNVNNGGRYDPIANNWENITSNGAPVERLNHTAIWSGNEMIIWGGNVGNNNLNSGGRYNPSINEWEITSVINAPLLRTGHTSVWTGNEMIVWGGDIDYFNDIGIGGRYNPISDSWTSITLDYAPSGRIYHSAIWTGKEMIIWGGFDGENSVNSGGRYNPETDSWQYTPVKNAPAGRRDHTAVWTGNEMIIWGGTSLFNTGGRYNPTTDKWQNTTTFNAPSGTNAHTAIWSGKEMIIWGGRPETYLSIYSFGTKYFLGGYVHGLLHNNLMILQNNQQNYLVLNHEGAFAFNTPLVDQQSYDVTIHTQPNDPSQDCEVLNGSGTINSNDVDDIIVNCIKPDLIFLNGFGLP